jgi:hypothetical protein
MALQPMNPATPGPLNAAVPNQSRLAQNPAPGQNDRANQDLPGAAAPGGGPNAPAGSMEQMVGVGGTDRLHAQTEPPPPPRDQATAETESMASPPRDNGLGGRIDLMA